MNVQDVIEKALAGNDGIPVTPVEHSTCEDGQVEKLASALNFIGANLESAVEEFEQEKTALVPLIAAGGLGGYGAHEARKEMRDAGMTEREINKVQTTAGGVARGVGKTLGYTALGSLAGTPGALVGMGYGMYRGYKGEKEKAMDAINDREDLIARLSSKKQKKTASVDNALYHAAQIGKQSLLEKVAEDRINPAKISAGAAAPYSGEIMPKGENVFGGQMMPSQLVAMKAQKVRARINSDMKKFVNNVGDGYNLQGHLNKMNK